MTGGAVDEVLKLDESAAFAGAEMLVALAKLLGTGVAVTGPAGSGMMAIVAGVALPGGSTGAAGVMLFVVGSNRRLMLQ